MWLICLNTVKYICARKYAVLAQSYDLFNSSKIFSNMLADIRSKTQFGNLMKNQNLSLALPITDLRFDVPTTPEKHSAFYQK